jgi:hypothetical protein
MTPERREERRRSSRPAAKPDDACDQSVDDAGLRACTGRDPWVHARSVYPMVLAQVFPTAGVP